MLVCIMILSSQKVFNIPNRLKVPGVQAMALVAQLEDRYGMDRPHFRAQNSIGFVFRFISCNLIVIVPLRMRFLEV